VIEKSSQAPKDEDDGNQINCQKGDGKPETLQNVFPQLSPKLAIHDAQNKTALGNDSQCFASGLIHDSSLFRLEKWLTQYRG